MTAKIVIGDDGSDGSLEALRWAADEARHRGAALEVVRACLPVAIYPPVVGDDSWSDLEPTARAELDKRLADEGLLENAGIDVTPRIIVGPTVEVLLDAAADADLLVVGSRGRGAFVGMLLGSVSLHCATHAPCPVVVVRRPKPA